MANEFDNRICSNLLVVDLQILFSKTKLYKKDSGELPKLAKVGPSDIVRTI